MSQTIIDEGKEKFTSQRHSSKKYLAHEPTLKSSTISTQRATMNKTMKRNVSYNKMMRENSLSKLDLSD